MSANQLPSEFKWYRELRPMRAELPILEVEERGKREAMPQLQVEE